MDRAIAFGAISWGFESLRTRAPLAQLAEHLTLNQRVEGSIPSRRIGSFVLGRMRKLPSFDDIYSLMYCHLRVFCFLHFVSGTGAGAGIW